MRIRRFTKQAGIFDLFKSKEKDKSGITPTTGAERIPYLTKKLDELLQHTPAGQHERAVKDFLASYLQLTPGEKDQIMKNLNWYKGRKQESPAAKPVRVKYKPGTGSDIWME